MGVGGVARLYRLVYVGEGGVDGPGSDSTLSVSEDDGEIGL